MSRMRDLMIEIQDMIEEGIFSYEEIARKLNIKVSWVREIAKSMEDDIMFLD